MIGPIMGSLGDLFKESCIESTGYKAEEEISS